MRSLILWTLVLASPALAAPGMSRPSPERERKPVQPEREVREEPVQVVMATRTVAPGAVVGAGDLTLDRVPERLAPPRRFASIEEVAGRVAVERLLADEPVRPERLADREAGGAWTAALPAGHRAVHLAVSDPLGDVVRPGDRIDVFATAEGTCLALADARVLRRAGDDGLWVAATAADAGRLAWTGDHALKLALPDPAGAPDPGLCQAGGAR